MCKTVNIVGMGKGKEFAPKENCWGINSVIFERDVDVHFDMHDERKMKPHQVERRKKIIWFANESDTPVYSCHEIPGTTYKRYPVEDVLAKFPRAYFSNGICYMIAYALLKGYKKISLWGVNHAKVGVKTDTYKFKDTVSEQDLESMDASTREYVLAMWDIPQSRPIPSMDEYVNQKPAVDYWLGIAGTLGVEINCNPESELLKTRDNLVYGYGISQDEMMKRYGPRNRIGDGTLRDAFINYVF